MIYGAAFSEQKLISIAYALEQLTNVRQQRSPVIHPSTDLKDILGRDPHMRGEPHILQKVLGTQVSGPLEDSRDDIEVSGEISRKAGPPRPSKV